ncbi:hypothetical protein CANINC_004097 [Pichia inconspicua]|uniref:Zn(2)-C6 fungal-type domain-containing protein n=1 Tax=Pichia inconspicua TaxID=52247 RepID=A0A4T0WYF8_9ASCO|nr:hypothetical protein CANINC_004097 [[Candida] inconspicua]
MTQSIENSPSISKKGTTQNDLDSKNRVNNTQSIRHSSRNKQHTDKKQNRKHEFSRSINRKCKEYGDGDNDHDQNNYEDDYEIDGENDADNDNDDYRDDDDHDEDDDDEGDGNDTENDIVGNGYHSSGSNIYHSREEVVRKRSKACKRCHSLKVKCVPLDPNDETQACKRCSAKGIKCEFNITVRRIKKPVVLSKSMKLKLRNEEIKKLKEQLVQRDRIIDMLKGYNPQDDSVAASLEISLKEKLGYYKEEIRKLEQHEKNSMETVPGNISTNFISTSEKRVQICQSQMPSLDIIGNGLLTYSQCTKLVTVFVTKIHARFPFTELPSNLSVDSLKVDAPLLLVIMCYISLIIDTCTEITVETQLQLECLISKTLSSEILMVGDKSFKLLKNTLIYSFWYVAPELFHHRRYHLFTSLCVSLSHDLGISGRPYFFYNKGDGSIKKTSIINDEKNIDLKGLLLVVYTLYTSISLFLKRVIYLEWNSYFEECCQVLEKSNKREYKLIVLYAKINHSMEMMYNSFHRAGECLTVYELSSHKTKLQIQEYVNVLLGIKQQISSHFDEQSFDYNCLMAYLYSAQAYLFEPAVQTLIRAKENVTKEYRNLFLTSLNQICESCILSLTHFNKLSIEDLSVNPLFHTSRILYTSGMLLRIRYLSLTIPKTARAKVYTEDALPTINALISKIDDTISLYPKNFFVQKIKLVLNLFVRTCLTQWNASYKILYKQIKKQDPSFNDSTTMDTLTNTLPSSTLNTPDIMTNSSNFETEMIQTHQQLRDNSTSGFKTSPYAMPGNAASYIKMQSAKPLMKSASNSLSGGIPSNYRTNYYDLDISETYSPTTNNKFQANTFEQSQEPSISGSPENPTLRNHTSISNLQENLPPPKLPATILSELNLPTNAQNAAFDMQFTAFNDEFWSDLFFGEGASSGYSLGGVDGSDTTPNSALNI